MSHRIAVRVIPIAACMIFAWRPADAPAAVGDPQVRTSHPWYPGELAYSTFERLAATQAALYHRVTGRTADTDEDKALAAWLWRNTHYAHGEEGCGDYFGKGYTRGEWNREYWHGLFAHGFGLCGTTHAQWTAELDTLLGPGRSRTVGVTGHNSFEVYLTGGAYGEGRWALLDHDVSTVIFDDEGKRLLSIHEIMADVNRYKDPNHNPRRQRGWRVAGLHDDDAGVFDSFNTVEYHPGYAGPPPVIHLRRGETLRRYLNPGLEDGLTFVFWGRNYNVESIPGPSRDRTWVNQPDKMHGSKTGAGWSPSRVRYGNAAYTYRPDFKSGGYREAVVPGPAGQVVFEFHTPYVIAATPPNDKPWGVYDPGCRNGLIVEGRLNCRVRVSTDGGATWHEPRGGVAADRIDLTDHVKGHQQYLLSFEATPETLADSGLTIRTVCQANMAILPRLHDGLNTITYHATGRGIQSAGPTEAQAKARLADGSWNQSGVTLELVPPRGEKVVALHAASWNVSGNPPSDTAYHIDYRTDAGVTWRPIVRDWRIIRRAPEPDDFWSQSFAYGGASLDPVPGPVRVRFTNDGKRSYRRVEAHLLYQVEHPTDARVTFAWRNGEDGPVRTAARTYPAAGATPGPDDAWRLDAGGDVRTLWVEFAAP